MTDLLLVTIPFSHYCEKARWALDRAGLLYEERAHLPIAHYLPARLAGGGKTVPVLKTPDRTLGDSTDILHWVDARLPEPKRLFPDDPGLQAEVIRWEGLFDDKLGPAARRWAYGHLLPDTALLRTVLQQNVPAVEALAMLGDPSVIKDLEKLRSDKRVVDVDGGDDEGAPSEGGGGPTVGDLVNEALEHLRSLKG